MSEEYKHIVDWRIWDKDALSWVSSRRLFHTLIQAEIYARKLKRAADMLGLTDPSRDLDVTISPIVVYADAEDE